MLNQAIWLSLPKNIRDEICVVFKIPRSGFVEVSDNKVVCDGHSNSDIALITVEKMQEFLGTNSADFYQLFGDVVAQLKGELKKAEDTKVPEIKNDVIEEKVKISPVFPNSKSVIQTESPKPAKGRGRSKKA